MSVRDFGGCAIVTIPGDVDARHVTQIQDSATAIDSRHVVVDLGAATAVPPSAASAVAALYRTVRAQGGTVRIVTRQGTVRTQLQQAARDLAPPFHDEIGDALEASMAAREAALGSRP